MKKTIMIAAILGITSGAYASEDPIYGKILSSLNQICADTWCEGDYLFQFEKMNCDFKAKTTFSDQTGLCLIEFSLKESGSASLKTKKGSCALMGYLSKAALQGDHTNSYSDGLSDRFYEEISDCISVWEAAN